MSDMINVRAPNLKPVLGEIAARQNVTITDLVKAACWEHAEEYKHDLPEHLAKDVTHQQIIKENSWKMRRMHFKKNVARKVGEELDSEWPSDISVFDSCYIESARREAKEEFDDTGELVEFCNFQLGRYSVLHPREQPEKNQEHFEKFVGFISTCLESGRGDMADKVAKEALHKDRLPPIPARWHDHTNDIQGEKTVIMKAAREENREGWKDTWDKAVWGES